MALEEETTLEELEASERNESTLFDGEDMDADIEVIVDDTEEPEKEEFAAAPIVEPAETTEPSEAADMSVTDADLNLVQNHVVLRGCRESIPPTPELRRR